MKRIAFVLLALVLLLTACKQNPTSKSEELLNMSDTELIEWVKEQGVEIPDDFDDEMMWADFVRSAVETTITYIDDPNYSAGMAINYIVTAEFGDAISEAVRNYIE